MATVATAITALRERLDEAVASQWDDVQLRRWLNEGIKDIARRSFHYQDVDTISVTANVGTYTAQSDVLRINQIYYTPTGDATQLIPLAPRVWDAMDQVWGNRQNIVSGYPSMFASRGYSPTVSIKLYPVPSVAGTLTLNVVRMPADLDIAGGSGNVDCPDGWVEIAYFYCEYMARRKDRDYEAAQEAFNQYGSMIDNMIQNGDYVNAPGEFTMGRQGYLPNWLTDPNWS